MNCLSLNCGRSSDPSPMFRFTIRDVLWLTVVVGLSLGLFQTAFKLAYLEPRYQRAQRQLEEAQKKLIDFQTVNEGDG
jgi:hypothetical protein